jgi:hypothetical protein
MSLTWSERTTLEEIAQADPELVAVVRLVVKQMERKATDSIAALDVVCTLSHCYNAAVFERRNRQGR